MATSPFARSVASLKDAISYGEGRVPETVLLDAAETLERLSQRRELSTEHTVIGFFGATGSGKSTLFNAIAGQNIALSAPTRPTTSTVQAAIWEEKAAKSCSTGSASTSASTRKLRRSPPKVTLPRVARLPGE